ncbi:ABC transporter permease subunit [Peribacillus frigoritolerans]|uniref:ABC transporter permease n=1 Tax=Peribacillus frigoritolerans TaxID=450367 RepID=UPI002E244EFE|nr:ABC transporter permease [Peribacillus frigoritolerans]MED3846689.1 ABC transporter permease [Peribacillus frigoritolerans]
MFSALFNSFESGMIYAIMALGVYLTFRILDFPDMTVEGSFVTGASVAAIMIVNGYSPIVATLCAMVAGFIAGTITGFLHTKGKINPLLAGILMMIALYSINLRIMGASNIPLLSQTTIITNIQDAWTGTGLDNLLNGLLSFVGLGDSLPKTWAILIVMLVVAVVIQAGMSAFLKTEIGLALRATGDNEAMVKSFSAHTGNMKILGLAIGNALVAFSGSLVAQYNGFSDIGMGIGIIVIGLASVIIGEALFGAKTIARATLAVIGGAIIYRIVVTLALRVEFLETGDVKLITALIVVGALVIPKISDKQKEKTRKKRRLKEIQMRHDGTLPKGREEYASVKSDL